MSRAVFISHSSRDREAAGLICEYLESRGQACWIAPRDIPTGSDWVESIIDGIDSASAMVLVVSSDSNRSPQVRREIERAVSRGLALVSVVIERVDFSKWMQYYISTRQWYDATRGDLERHLPAILEALGPGEEEVKAGMSNLATLLESDISRLASEIEYEEGASTARLEEGERRKAAVLSIEVRRPAGAHMSRRALSRIAETISGMVGKVVQAYGGFLERDEAFSFRCVFGVERALEDDSQRAVSSAIRVFNGLGQINGVLRAQDIVLDFMMGASAGVLEVSRDVIGGQKVSGSALDEADSLAEREPRNVLLVTKDVFRDCRGRYPFEPCGELYGQPTYELTEYTMQPPADEPSQQEMTPFVGRKRELDELRSLAARQVGGTEPNRRGGCKHLVIGIRGEAGAGKTRLVRELRRELEADHRDPPLILCSRTMAYAQPPYWLWTSMLRQLLGLGHDERPGYGEFRARLSGLSGDEALTDSAPFLAELLSIDPGDSGSSSMDEAARSLEIRAALRNVFRAVAATRRLVLVLDDLHRTGSTCRSALEFIIAECDSKRPILMIMLYRSEREDGSAVEFAILPGYAEASELCLEPLSTRESEELMQEVLTSMGGSGEASDRLRTLLLGCSRGNPFFMEEMIRELVESGTATETGQGWDLPDRPGDSLVPSTLSGLLQSRLDRLPGDQKAVLQGSSVLGMEFLMGLFRSLAARVYGSEDEARLLDDLERRQFLSCERSAFERRYAFPSKLIHDVAYDSMLESNRRLLHRAAAESIEEFFPEDQDGVASALAYHWDRAGDPRRAVRWGLRALVGAAASYQNEDALMLAERLIELLDSLPPGDEADGWMLDVLLQKARVEGVLGLKEQELATIRRSMEMTADGRYPRRECEIAIEMAHYLEMDGKPGESRSLYEKALAIAREIGDTGLQSIALMNLAGAEHRAARPDEAMSLYEQARKLAVEGGTLLMEAQVVLNIGVLHHRLGRMDQAMESYDETIGLLERIGDRKALATVLVNQGILHSNQDRTEKALEHYGRAMRLFREIGFRRGEAATGINMGIVYRELGNYPEARELFSQAIQLNDEIGDRQASVVAMLNLGALHQDQGELDEAEECFRKSLETGLESDSIRLEGHARFGLGSVHRLKGRLHQAREELETALGILREIGERKSESAALSTLGLLCCDEGQPEEGLARYSEALEILEDLELGVLDSEDFTGLRDRLMEMGCESDRVPLPSQWESASSPAGGAAPGDTSG
ncbi:tetratricopeptide repeat protein [Candidatus Fermentibacterales bacterium]|nr:tetratricopeptide repeat protein [Candidatus Fermentibacterales bacterium]